MRNKEKSYTLSPSLAIAVPAVERKSEELQRLEDFALPFYAHRRHLQEEGAVVSCRLQATYTRVVTMALFDLEEEADGVRRCARRKQMGAPSHWRREEASCEKVPKSHARSEEA